MLAQTHRNIKITIFHAPFTWAMPPPCGLHSNSAPTPESPTGSEPKVVLFWGRFAKIPLLSSPSRVALMEFNDTRLFSHF